MLPLFENLGLNFHIIKDVLKRDFAVGFLDRCDWLPDGCVVYRGGGTVRIPLGLYYDVTFTTPRRAAFIMVYNKLPGFELKLSCGTPGCVTPKHFVPGRQRRPFRISVTRNMILEILRERKIGIRGLARKHGIDRKKIRKILAVGLKYPYSKPEVYKPKYTARGF